jgi:aminoglycoside 6-adenylyltransferase
MMAWQARAKNGPGLDTWHDGRYMEEWADPRIVDQLPVFFAPYEIAASARALGEMISLYLWMVKETAVLLPQPFPLDFQDRVRDWIESELKKIV